MGFVVRGVKRNSVGLKAQMGLMRREDENLYWAARAPMGQGAVGSVGLAEQVVGSEQLYLRLRKEWSRLCPL